MQLSEILQKKVDAIEKKIDWLIANQSKKEIPEYISVPEAAKICNKSELTIRRWIKDRKLEASKLASGSKQDKYIINRKTFENFLRGK